jgi:3-ketoacyl-CoA synthase
VFESNKPLVVDLGWKTMSIFALLLWYITRREQPVYLLDFSCFEPPADWKVSQEQLMQIMKFQGCFTDESLDFLSRMLQQSGVGPSTAWPPGTVQCLEGKAADTSAEAARKESEVLGTISNLKFKNMHLLKWKKNRL